MARWNVEFYRSASGSIPVRDFLDGLPQREAARVARALTLLEDYGADLGMPYARKLADSDLWELRVRGKLQHRIFYIAIHDRNLLLLHAFTKKSQRTPAREIKTAEQRFKDYLERSSP